jgi:hypothetical protein
VSSTARGPDRLGSGVAGVEQLERGSAIAQGGRRRARLVQLERGCPEVARDLAIARGAAQA